MSKQEIEKVEKIRKKLCDYCGRLVYKLRGTPFIGFIPTTVYIFKRPTNY